MPPSTTFIATGQTQVHAASLYAVDGARLSLPFETSYDEIGYDSRFVADGAGKLTINAPVPNQNGLTGAKVYMQLFADRGNGELSSSSRGAQNVRRLGVTQGLRRFCG